MKKDTKTILKYKRFNIFLLNLLTKSKSDAGGCKTVQNTFKHLIFDNYYYVD